jgi:chromosome segregation ATPase
MRNRFLLEGEINGDVLIAVEFNVEALNIHLNVLPKSKENHDLLRKWVRAEATLPDTANNFVRTVADATLLPEEIKVTDVGKVRQLEIEWGNILIQSRLLKGFHDDLTLIKQKLSTLDNFSQELFDETASFWEKLLEFKKEYNLPNEKIDEFKIEVDVVFEALKALRKDSKKEFDEQSIEKYAQMKNKLSAIEQKLSNENFNKKSISGELKNIRAEFLKTAMRKNHKQEIDETINILFEKLSQTKQKVVDEKTEKRIGDLQQILEKMNKSLDWEKRELQKEEKNRLHTDQQFQLKLLDAKIGMLKNKIAEKEEKISNINATLSKLKK